MSEKTSVVAIDCWDWLEVELNTHHFFAGYLEGRETLAGVPSTLKLKDWPSHSQFNDRLPRHGAEFERALPLHPYCHPQKGELNLFSSIPQGHIRPDLGPKTYIAYGYRPELGMGDSVTKLHLDMADAINILTHCKEVPLKPHVLRKVRCFKDKLCSGQGQEDSARAPQAGAGPSSEAKGTAKGAAGLGQLVAQAQSGTWYVARGGAALWDIWRQEDKDKLRAFIRSREGTFRHLRNESLQGKIVHEIHDQVVYLYEEHKEALKREFGVEAWSFEQGRGDAVFVPAGCPHQVRNMESCMKVAVDFVSPENLSKCFELVEEFRVLPLNHRAKEDKLAVVTMLIHATQRAINVLRSGDT